MLDQALLEEVILFMEQPEQQRTRRLPAREYELMELMLHPAFQLPEPREQPEPQKATPAPVDDLPEGFWRLTQVIEQLRQERAGAGAELGLAAPGVGYLARAIEFAGEPCRGQPDDRHARANRSGARPAALGQIPADARGRCATDAAAATRAAVGLCGESGGRRKTARRQCRGY